MVNNTISLDDFANIFRYLIGNNKKLEDSGKGPIAIGATGPAGLGKTTIVEDLAKEMGMTYVKLSLAQIDEAGDLVGFPIKEFKIQELHTDGSFVEKWVSEPVLKTYFQRSCDDYKMTDESRMGYAVPSWLPMEENPNGTILLIDDLTRGNQIVLQAVMELICKCEFISWHLPKYTTIVTTENPDNGLYNVNSTDSAFKSRYVNFNIGFDISSWGRWCERYELDNRAINFGLLYPEIFENDAQGVQKVNPRSYTIFCNSISGIENWNDFNSLSLILSIAKGCFGENSEVIGGLFTTFLANKLDKLIAPKDILLGNWQTVKTRVKDCVYDEENKYHPEIASILSTRLLNYITIYFSTTGSKTDAVQDRLLEFIDSEEMLFSEDLLFNIIKNLNSKFPARCNKLLMNQKIRSKII